MAPLVLWERFHVEWCEFHIWRCIRCETNVSNQLSRIATWCLTPGFPDLSVILLARYPSFFSLVMTTVIGIMETYSLFTHILISIIISFVFRFLCVESVIVAGSVEIRPQSNFPKIFFTFNGLSQIFFTSNALSKIFFTFNPMRRIFFTSNTLI